MVFVFVVAYNGLDQVKWVQNIGGPILVVIMILLMFFSINMIHEAGYTVGQAFSQGNDWALSGAERRLCLRLHGRSDGEHRLLGHHGSEHP